MDKLAVDELKALSFNISIGKCILLIPGQINDYTNILGVIHHLNELVVSMKLEAIKKEELKKAELEAKEKEEVKEIIADTEEVETIVIEKE